MKYDNRGAAQAAALQVLQMQKTEKYLMGELKTWNAHIHGPTADASIVGSQDKSVLGQPHICHISRNWWIDFPAVIDQD